MMQPIGASYGSHNPREVARRIVVPKRKALRAKEERQRRRRALAASVTVFVLAGVCVCAFADWNDGQMDGFVTTGASMTAMTTAARSGTDTANGWLKRSSISSLDPENIDVNENGRLEWGEVDVAIAYHRDKVLEDIRATNLSESEKASVIVAVSTSVFTEAECAFSLLQNTSDADTETTWNAIVEDCCNKQSEEEFGSQVGSTADSTAASPYVGSEETFANLDVNGGSGSQAGQRGSTSAEINNADGWNDAGEQGN